MIAPKFLVATVFAEPFRPFRLHMASGRSFDVRHPEMIKVGRSSVTVYSAPQGDSDAPERWQEVSLMLLESVEPLDAASLSESH